MLMERGRTFEASKIKQYTDIIFKLHRKYVEELKENEELKKQLKMFEGKLRDDLVLQQKASANWLKYCLKKADDEQI